GCCRCRTGRTRRAAPCPARTGTAARGSSGRSCGCWRRAWGLPWNEQSGGLGGGRRLEVDELVVPGVPGRVEQPGPRLGAEERLARQRPALEVEQLLRRPVALDDEVLVPADALHLGERRGTLLHRQVVQRVHRRSEERR